MNCISHPNAGHRPHQLCLGDMLPCECFSFHSLNICYKRAPRDPSLDSVSTFCLPDVIQRHCTSEIVFADAKLSNTSVVVCLGSLILRPDEE